MCLSDPRGFVVGGFLPRISLPCACAMRIKLNSNSQEKLGKGPQRAIHSYGREKKSRGKTIQSGISLPGPLEANRLPDLNHSAVLLLDFSSPDSLSTMRTMSEHKGV